MHFLFSEPQFSMSNHIKIERNVNWISLVQFCSSCRGISSFWKHAQESRKNHNFYYNYQALFRRGSSRVRHINNAQLVGKRKTAPEHTPKCVWCFLFRVRMLLGSKSAGAVFWDGRRCGYGVTLIFGFVCGLWGCGCGCDCGQNICCCGCVVEVGVFNGAGAVLDHGEGAVLNSIFSRGTL